MGAYIYMVRSPRQNVKVTINSEVHEAARLCYLYKPWWPSIGRDRNTLYNATITRMENLWRTANKTVSFVVVCDKDTGPKPGDSVRSWWPGWISVLDDPNYGGTVYLGKLTLAIGGVWQVEAYQPTLGVLNQ